MSDSVRPQRRQPTRLPRPWDSPGKNTGVGCHFLLQWMKVKSESEVTQSCPTLSDPMDAYLGQFPWLPNLFTNVPPVTRPHTHFSLGPKLVASMATHSSILVWKISWTEQPATGSQRVGHNWSNLTCTHACAEARLASDQPFRSKFTSIWQNTWCLLHVW